jgi:hypothetical protein
MRSPRGIQGRGADGTWRVGTSVGDAPALRASTLPRGALDFEPRVVLQPGRELLQRST